MAANPAFDLTADEHSEAMHRYIEAGTRRAFELDNRGPIRFDDQGAVHPDILASYWQHGFYILQDVIDMTEVEELRQDVDRVLRGQPAKPGSSLTLAGETAIGQEFKRDSFLMARPLTDPVGGTAKNKGRHPVKMLEPTPAGDAPEYIVARIYGNLQLMDSALRLAGHHGLLSVCAAINGQDFVPYTEVTFVKAPGLGVSIAWHRDGTTHWQAPDWDAGAHGFNYMAQLYPSTPGNGVWVLPGTHAVKDVDISQLVAESGSERIEGAVPMICEAGDVVISNRQLVHGSFANTSAERRVTLNMGYFPRKRVQDVTATRLDGSEDLYDDDRVERRSRIIALSIDARAQRFPDERRYRYEHLTSSVADNRWNEQNRTALLKHYNSFDFYI